MTIDKVLFHTQKDKMLLDYNDGTMTQSVGEFLQQSGIQDPTRFVFGGNKAVAAVKKIKEERAKSVKEKKPAKIAAPFVQMGLAGKDLVIQIKDNSNSKFEENTVMMKGFLDAVEKEKSKSVAVVNISEDKEEDIIKQASINQAIKHGTTVTTEDTTDFGDITGNIVLCAHGTPKVVPGKVIGVELGGKTPQQIVDMLTTSKDKAKRIAKTFSGTITLSGCFTAAGGPEAEEADPVFAKKVLDILIGKGYKNLRVVGFPGCATTSRSDTQKDNYGKTMKTGEKGAWHAMEDYTQSLQASQLKIDANIEKLNKAFDNWKGTEEEFENNSKVKELQAQMKKDSDELDRLVKKQEEALKGDPNEINASKMIAGLHGYFGPAKYKTKPWYKKLFS